MQQQKICIQQKEYSCNKKIHAYNKNIYVCNKSIYMDNKIFPYATKIYVRQYIQQYICTHAVLMRPIYWCAIYIVDTKKYVRHLFYMVAF